MTVDELLSSDEILTLALQGLTVPAWLKTKAVLSLSLGMAAVRIFIISRQPYAAPAFSLPPSPPVGEA